jgi:hypothetical protein
VYFPNDPGCDAIQRDHSISQLLVHHCLGHTVNDASIGMLRENRTPSPLDGSTSLGAISPHAGQHDSQNVPFVGGGGRTKENVDCGSAIVLWWILVGFDAHAFACPNQLQVLSTRGYVDGVGLGFLPHGSFDDL